MVQMSSSLYCLACSKGKWKSNLQTNKAGGQRRGLPEVLGVTRFFCFMTFQAKSAVSLVFFYSDYIFQWFILKIFEKKKEKVRWNACLNRTTFTLNHYSRKSISIQSTLTPYFWEVYLFQVDLLSPTIIVFLFPRNVGDSLWLVVMLMPWRK